MAGKPEPLVITPETKVGAFVERYPDLEDLLISMSPSFQKLRNPILRKTVAKLATLRQVAQVGGIPVGVLVNRLRAAAGVEAMAGLEERSADEGHGRPEWADPAKVVRTFDARGLIEGGGQPMEQVMGDLAALAAGEAYELLTPFAPAPLVERAAAKGFRSWSTTEAADLVRTYFSRT